MFGDWRFEIERMIGREWYKSRSLRNGKDSPGCMSGVLHFFVFQEPHQSPKSYSSQNIIPEPVFLPGLEAPRNSLEICGELGELPMSEAMEEEIPIGFRLVPEATVTTAAATRPVSKGREKEETTERKRMPNLVARLMGLDLLPDYDHNTPSNRNSSASDHRNNYDDYDYHCGRSRSVSSTTIQGSFNQSQEKQLRELKREFHVRQALQNRNGNAPAERKLDTLKTNHSCSSLETPRISSARKSDATDPRLSLQINNENVAFTDFSYTLGSKPSAIPDSFQLNFDLDTAFSPCSNPQRKALTGLKENKSPGDYAREIVKQVKETVIKKAGVEIGNINSNDQGLVLNAKRTGGGTIWGRSKNSPRRLTNPTNKSGESRHSIPSCSPRLRFLSHNKPIGTHQEQTSSSLKTPPKSGSLTTAVPISQSQKPKLGLQSATKSKPNCQRFSSKLKKPNPTVNTTRTLREEPFVHATLKITPIEKFKTPLSNNLLNVVSPVVAIKKEKERPTKIRSSKFLQSPGEFYHPEFSTVQNDDETQAATNSQFSGSTSQLYQPKSLDNRESHAQYLYVKNILDWTGIYSSSCISFTKWYSPAHPIDPNLFYRLESTQSSVQLQQLGRPDRLLLFHLVDEILGHLLKPYLNMKPWAMSRSTPVSVFDSCVQRQGQLTGKQLLERLCYHIRSFPSANCQHLCDIDSLVERDFQDFFEITVSPENENIVFEIERQITETLLHEAVFQIYFPAIIERI